MIDTIELYILILVSVTLILRRTDLDGMCYAVETCCLSDKAHTYFILSIFQDSENPTDAIWSGRGGGGGGELKRVGLHLDSYGPISFKLGMVIAHRFNTGLNDFDFHSRLQIYEIFFLILCPVPPIDLTKFSLNELDLRSRS